MVVILASSSYHHKAVATVASASPINTWSEHLSETQLSFEPPTTAEYNTSGKCLFHVTTIQCQIEKEEDGDGYGNASQMLHSEDRR